jgi:nucleotide-binding universal stress UspA family protein
MNARWIVGVDGSDEAVDALRWATHHAAPRHAEVTAVNAFHVPAIMSMMVAKRGFGVDELGLQATAGHDLDTAIERVGGNVTALVVEGQASHVLVDTANEADLLVVGQRGSGDLRSHRLGSVSRYCATHAQVPVVVVPAPWSPGPNDRIVVGFDGSENAAAAVRWALEFASPSASITVVSAVEVAPWLGEALTRERFPDEVAEQEQQMAAAVDELDPERRTTRSVVLDAPRVALSDAAKGADLVVVGARGRGVIAAGFLGSVSTWLLQDAAAPVVIVPHGD